MEMMPVSTDNLPVRLDTKALSAAFSDTTVGIITPDGGMVALRTQQFTANYNDVRGMPDGFGAQSYAARFAADPRPEQLRKTWEDTIAAALDGFHREGLGYNGALDPYGDHIKKKQKIYAKELQEWEDRQKLKPPKAKAQKAKI